MFDNLPESTFETPNNIYKDALQPSVQEIGTALQTISQTLNTFLIPLRALNETIDIKYRKFIEDLSTKASSIPKEKLCSPELATVGPALMDVAFSLDEETIREMYLNLLTQSVNSINSTTNLRAFTQIIKQLSPFEARLFKHMFESDTLLPVATICLLCIPSQRTFGQSYFGKSYDTLLTNISFDNASEDLIHISLQNYLRLGLIELNPDCTVNPLERYDYVQGTSTYIKAYSCLHTKSETGEEFNRLDTKKFSFSITSFGKLFYDICCTTFK